MLARLNAALPARWLADLTPVLDGVLAGPAAIWATLYAQLQSAIAQTRIATATGAFLDLISTDYFGPRLPRRLAESDAAFRPRVLKEMQRERATRTGLIATLTDLTGRAPSVFEPSRPADTGGWNAQNGYGLAGRYGSLMLPRQVFVIAHRPLGTGIAQLPGGGASQGGWNSQTGYGDATLIAGQVSDTEIMATTAATMPAASIAWIAISN